MKHAIQVTLAACLLAAHVAGLQADESMDHAREQIHEEATDVQPLFPGMTAPSFTVREADGSEFTFNPMAMDKPVVITFFRGGWCPYCNLHLAEFRKAESELAEMGFDIWFISVDRPEVLYASLEQPDISYRLFSDSKLDATRQFGIAFRMDEEQVKAYKDWGIDLEEVSGETHHALPAPSTFLVATDGKIRFQYTNPDYSVRLHPDILLAAARVHRADSHKRLREQQRARREAD